MRLENWEMNYDGRMTGEIYNDYKKRFPDGTMVTTAKVIEVKRNDSGDPIGILTSSGSEYELGKQYVKV